MATATKARTFEGTYEADPVHSVFGFSVLHNEISTYSGTLDEVSATLSAEGDEVSLQGAAKVESISIREPEQFRGHVLGAEFFNAASHPEVTFRSTAVELGEDGKIAVTGELSIAGKSREVTANGTYRAPIADPLGNDRIAIELETTFDRRDFGFDWQMELPSGGDVLAWDVTLDIHLELTQPGEDA